jgi:vancomycin permeability regulator SanA
MRWLIRLTLAAILLPALYLGWTAAGIWQTAKQDQRPASDAIVVLGAAQYDGDPSRVFEARLDHARELYEAGVAPLIVVLGGKQAGDRFTEAQAGAAYLEKDLPADRVTGVKAGVTTLDSLKKFTGLAEERNIHRIVIVSDPLHLGRARQMAEDLGFEVAVSASTIDQSEERTRTGLIKETFTLAFYRIFSIG